MNNRQAALIAASSMWPEAYKLKQFGTITSQQVMQAIYERSEELEAWLNAKDEAERAGAPITAREAHEIVKPTTNHEYDQDELHRASWWER